MRRCLHIIIGLFFLNLLVLSNSYANNSTHYTVIDEIKSPTTKKNYIQNLLMDKKWPDKNIKNIAANPYCTGKYVECIQGQGQVPGRVYGTSQCADCLGYCNTYGYWPPACI
ncbi:hypothetical protein PEC301899_02790 [Pectobacterium carotovorum subsp. carotovorum]|nr:hypothetical protein PEC301899_02790 [Pectobacterium carotovorum subsp. carotovorum]